MISMPNNFNGFDKNTHVFFCLIAYIALTHPIFTTHLFSWVATLIDQNGKND